VSTTVATILLLLAAGLVPARAQTTSAPSYPVAIAVYTTALRFYDPPGGQRRWLESPMIDEDGAPTGVALDPALATDLLERMGDDFRPWTKSARGSGGRVALSRIRAVAPDSFRVIIGYRHHTPYAEGPATFQSFLVGRDSEGWRILARGSVPERATPNVETP
jgi:hypothetical protein